MARPPFWKRQYLLEPKLQFGITIYFLLFVVGTLATIYFGVKQALLSVLQHSAALSPACSTLMTENEETVRTILTTVFTTNAVIVTLFALVGGILISHRIVGPIYRIKQVLRQIAHGEDPGEIRLRNSDYFSDVVPLLRELQRARKTEKV